ncbi:MAG TPA: ATP-binding protein [Lentisphaeria bacterium]|nr:ATP-binding protein [Lentisphaeria bacterium]
MAKDIPEESKHCALLAVNTLKAAVGDYQERNKKQNECNSPDEDCSKCDKEECASRKTESSFIEKDENLQLRRRLEKIKNKILVLSGKGGVGKSTMAVNIASVLASEGKKVGILDVDIHGPSIPMMLGVDKLTPMTDGEDILPVTDGVLKIMSIGFFLRSNDDPVIWRGPMKMNMIKQFLKDVRWGDIDYLVIDCPPGTGDEPLSVCQLIEAPSGAIIVTTPQNVAINDVRKSINFCHSLQLKILGVIENMSGFKCPNCGEVSNIFKEGGAEKMASDFKVPFLGRIPIEGEIVISGDSGKSLMNKVSASTAEELKKIVSQIISKTN